MIAMIQVFGLQGVAGGPKLLRGLLRADHPPVLSVYTGFEPAPAPAAIREMQLPLRPHMGRIDHTRLHSMLGVFEGVFRPGFERKLRCVLQENGVKAIHLIPHGYNVVPVFHVARDLKIPLFLSIHDDLEYAALGHPLRRKMLDVMAQAWRSAAGAYVISDAIGAEYNRRYGARRYEIVTDGLESIASGPCAARERSLHVYFMGLFHPGYKTNFRAMLDALKILRDRHPDWEISVTSRSAYIVCPLQPDDVPVHVVQFTPDPRDAEKDMAQADLLYLPMPFEKHLKNFGKFSMSTKMVSYLGSGLPIFYHGPAEAAAADLLTRHKAAAVCTELAPKKIAEELLRGVREREMIVNGALALAKDQFMLQDQQRRFWIPLAASLQSQAAD